MARLIKFKAQCYVCFKWFDKGQAWLTLRKGVGWKCQCFECFSKKKEQERQMKEHYNKAVSQ